MGIHAPTEGAPGAALIGWAYAMGPTLAMCPTNALNALVKRHLVEPKNKIDSFNVRTIALGSLLRHYNAAYAEYYGKWRTGKGIAKLNKIDQSVAEEANRLDKVKMMVKKEVYTQLLDGSSKILQKARGIQFTVNERTNYEYVEEAHAFSHALASLTEAAQTIDGIEFLVRYASQMNHDEIGAFATVSEKLRLKYADSCIDERDGKCWDANVQEAHKEALYQVYDALDPKFAAYARKGLTVSGTYRKGSTTIKYTVTGTVKSGHFDTSSGNGFLNREISIQAILQLTRHRPKLVRGLVFGDDYLAWLYFDSTIDDDELEQDLSSAERSLGIDPERGILRNLLHASFISLGFYRTVDMTIVAMPKIGRLLCRLFWTTKHLNGRDPKRLAAGIAEAFWPLYRTYPPMRAFLQHHMQVAPHKDYVGPYYEWVEKGMKKLPSPVNWDLNHLEKYGPTALMLEPLDYPSDAGLANHPIVNLMYRMDASDPCDRKPGRIEGLMRVLPEEIMNTKQNNNALPP